MVVSIGLGCHDSRRSCNANLFQAEKVVLDDLNIFRIPNNASIIE